MFNFLIAIKTLNIIAIALSVLLIVLSFYYIDEVLILRRYRFGDYSLSNQLKTDQLTFFIGLCSLLFFIPFLLIFIKQLKLRRIISIIGIILTALIVVWDLMMISSSNISFDEIGLAWVVYGTINIVLFILLLRNKRATGKQESDEVIDDLMI